MAIDRIRVTENSNRVITFSLLDSDGAPVPSASLTEATLTLFDWQTSGGGSPAVGIINARDGQNVLNANDVTIGATDGSVTWTMQPEDNVIVTERRQVERHRAMFHFAWATGLFDYELEIEVTNLRQAS